MSVDGHVKRNVIRRSAKGNEMSLRTDRPSEKKRQNVTVEISTPLACWITVMVRGNSEN